MMNLMRRREFAYSEVFCHPLLDGSAFGTGGGHIRADVPREIATVCKNESNCTVFLIDGTWFTTWGQGSHEGHPDERIVFSVSRDMGRTWTPPSTIQASCPEREERVAYGVPFVVPKTDRIYLFFFVTANTEGKIWAREGRLDSSARRFPEHASGRLHFVYSDDVGRSWSERHRIRLPRRDINAIPDRVHGWVNHPPQIMPTGEVIFTFGATGMNAGHCRGWQLGAAEVNVLRCDNILEETDPEKLRFMLLPEGPRGIRVHAYRHWDNPALRRLLDFFDGTPEDTVWNFQEMTVVPLSNGNWLGVGRSFLGSPGFTVSTDRGASWTPAEPLCYGPDGEPIAHPMTMCPIARTSDGRYVLLFCNNDGSGRGARHVWDGDGRTRNPQWMVVGREIPGETRSGGLVFGEPMILADVDDSGEVNLKTGVSMPQFFEREGRYFVCYNVNKEHIVLDEIPAEVLDRLTPRVECGMRNAECGMKTTRVECGMRNAECGLTTPSLSFQRLSSFRIPHSAFRIPMAHRERMIRTVRFQEVDCLPIRHAYGLMPGVLEDWYDEGLPSSVGTEQEIYEYFGFPTRALSLPLNVGFDPPFETKVIEENEEYRIATDGMGRATKMAKKYASIALPMEYPVKDEATWAEYRRRLVFAPERVGADLERVAAANGAAGQPNVFGARGFYWFPRDLMGDEGLCVAYYEQPELVRDIVETWCTLIEEVLTAALERVRLDGIHFGEDMAYRNASIVGSTIFDAFLRPYYERIHRLVERYDVPIFSVDTDGCVEELIEWFWACGVNMIGPNEVQAGNDICAYRRRFGRRMAYDGGLDKRVLTRGRGAIDEMLENTIPFMKETGGGWLVCLDHRVVKGTRFADFRYYVDRIREMGRF